MIIDAHTHIWKRSWLPEEWWPCFAKLIAHRHHTSMDEAWERLAEMWDNPSDTMVELMNEAGIDKMLIECIDWGLADTLDEPETSIEEQNRLYAEAVQRHPARLMWAAGVDPRRKNAIQIVEEGVKEYGAKALKLHPAAGFYTNDRSFYPLYEKCVELGIPIDVHTGPHVAPLRSKYCQPIDLDDVATDFPELTVIVTHMGHGSWEDTLFLARANPNMVCNVAGWFYYPHTGPHLLKFYEKIRYIMDVLGPGRFMFASDWLGLKDVATYAGWLRTFTEIPQTAREAGIEFTKEELDDFLGGAAAKVFHLDAS